MTFRPRRLYAHVQYALAEIQHGRHWAGDWHFNAAHGITFRSRRLA